LERGLYIGRFQPLHIGHFHSLKWCCERTDELIVAVGSSDKSFEYRNPFTAGERIEMIRKAIVEEDPENLNKIIVIPVPDTGTHALWTRHVDLLVPSYDMVFTNDPFTYMLYDQREMKIIRPEMINRENMSATEVRQLIAKDHDWQELLLNSTINLIDSFKGVDRIKKLYEMVGNK
jgi:nicotinamide-nucleotide adenylyltransferase